MRLSTKPNQKISTHIALHSNKQKTHIHIRTQLIHSEYAAKLLLVIYQRKSRKKMYIAHIIIIPCSV
jgi:hypothetical protein